MFRALKIFVLVVALVAPLAVQAQTASTAATGPCEQIKQACERAGFVPGEAKAKAKKGISLWEDCVGPIMEGKAQPKNATLKLPAVDPNLVSACKTEHPNWHHEIKTKKGQ